MGDPSEHFKEALEAAENAVERMVTIGQRNVGDAYSQYIGRAECLSAKLRDAADDWKRRRGQGEAW